MKEFIQNLPDGWTIYLWIIAAGFIIVAAVLALRWASKNGQFDEDIKYLVFDEKDKEKMTPEEFARSQEVNKEQMRLREEELNLKAERKSEKSDEKG